MTEHIRQARIALLLAVILCAGFVGSARGAPRFELKRDEVVVFFGDANMLHLQQAGHLEAILTQAFASARPSFRDFSWEADTVFQQGTVIERWRTDGFGNRDEQLKRVGATVIVAQFGQLESLAGADGLDGFTKAYVDLIVAFQRQAQRVVLVTPPPFEKPDSPLVPDLTQHNADLAKYVSATDMIASQKKLMFVDLFHPPQSTGTGTLRERKLTDDGMQVTSGAQPYIANEIARQLGVEVADDSDLETLRQAVVEKHRLWYDYWRPANWKLLYGDDARRQFTRGGEDYIPFQEEWKKLIPLIAEAEQRVWRIAEHGKDPGDGRPVPEVLHGASEADVETELAAFTTLDDLQVNLFAAENDGLTSPLAVRWDPAGRMYVTVTTTYPHVFPGDVPNDKVILLQDTDHDGTADKSTVFADGLNIPTGLEWGDGGVYVGQNTELLFLQDTDGDGVADERRVVLGGFGNGDSHQTINSFVWSPGGELFFGQGDGCESRVETPWGVSNLFQAGFYRLRPRRLQLDPLLDDFMGPGNPWGVAFDRWGQIFSLDGAGGVTFLSPGQVPTTHRLQLRTIGKPGGYCGITYLDGTHLPTSLQGNFAVGDYKGNQVKRFSVADDGAGFSLQWHEPLLQSRHRNFRPVDVKVGPDGAIYVVDWYNPITCHQDDAYRDPTRDKAHGRIWRLSETSADPIKTGDLSQAALDEVLDSLASSEPWTRYQAKRELTTRDAELVANALANWIESLDPTSPQHEHHLYEALGAYATIEVVEPNLLQRLLRSQEPRARAYAARMVGRWQDRLPDPLELLAPRVTDENARVRMEAVMACAAVPSPDSITVAARVVDEPMDEWITYAFKQTVHHLNPHWLPTFQRGEIVFAKPNHAAAVLNEAGGREVLTGLKQLIAADDVAPKTRMSAILGILAVGTPSDLREYGLENTHFTHDDQYDDDAHAQALGQLAEVARIRDIRAGDDHAESDAGKLAQLIKESKPQLQIHALTLAGLWKTNALKDEVLAVAQNASLPVAVRAAAFETMVRLDLPESHKLLAAYAQADQPAQLRTAAIKPLAEIDTPVAAQLAAELLSQLDLEATYAAATITAFLNRVGGDESLAASLESRRLPPALAKQRIVSLFSTGRSSPTLFATLNQASGASTQRWDYSEALVEQLMSDVARHGQAERGALLFKSMACVSCHKIENQGGEVGPNLTAIGTTLSMQRIIEEVLWPNRQVKEGYSIVQVITDEGRVIQGYERRTRESQESGELVVKELTTGNLLNIDKNRIEDRIVTGSAMPDGLTTSLSRSQLLDLVRYLSDL